MECHRGGILITEWRQREVISTTDLPYTGALKDFFLARGFSSSEAIDQFLNFQLKDLRDPLSIIDMQKAVDRLMQAFKKQETICIYADFDMDGTPGLALVLDGLTQLGFKNLIPVQPDRHKDGYGFHTHIVDRIIQEHRASLFVTVDLGITDVQTVEAANAKGVDVIITDHHQEAEQLPRAIAVVNPNRKDCTSGLGHLCGTGVGFYLIMALRRALKNQGLLEKDFDVKTLLDCFAIATLADMVPVIYENRILVKHGLQVLQNTKRFGLKVLLEALQLSEKKLSSSDVTIRFVPKLNALTRLESEIKPIDVFLVNDPSQALAMVERVLATNQQRVKIMAACEKALEKNLETDEAARFVWSWSKEFHKGVIGLLATQIVKRKQKPAFIGTLTADGKIVGSARTPEENPISVLEPLKFASDTLKKFGGHPAAAGFELEPENAEAFRKKLEEFFSAENLIAENRVLTYDFSSTYGEIRQFMSWWDKLEPFGQHFSPPLIHLKDVEVTQLRELKGGHLRLTLRSEKSESFEAMWFGVSPEERARIFGEENTAPKITLLVEPQWNEYMGTRRVQLLIKDIRSL